MPTYSFFKYVKNFFCFIISCILPRRFKRYVILTTIYKKGVDENVFVDEDFKTLNDRLHIATNVKAMENISVVSGRLWSDLELQTLIREAVSCDLEGEKVPIEEGFCLGQNIAKAVPAWLRYDKSKMASDIACLFKVEKVSTLQ